MLNDLIDTILVPQGAEYQAVQQGRKIALHQNTIGVNRQSIFSKELRVIPIPLGSDRTKKEIKQNPQICGLKSQKVLIMGLCGSLSPDYSVGDIVMYHSCYCRQENLFLETDEQFTVSIKHQLNLQTPLVRGLTSDRIVCTTKEKQTLAQTYHTSVVDMEGFPYLQQLQSQNVSVAILRIVSDDIFYDIPDLNSAINQFGSLQPIPTAISMLRQPIAAIRFIQGSIKSLQILKRVTSQVR